jgi:hypothetical protein
MRVDFTVTGTSVSDARLESNIAYARSLGLPSAEHRASGRALNIIGRGPSVARYTDILKTDDADAWACGSAWAWCRDNGIDAAAIFADPSPFMAAYARDCKRAIVSEQCDPLLFTALEGADVRVMSLDQWAVGHSAATIATVLGSNPGVETRLYGCEGSYEATTHADEDQPQLNLMIVRCNGETFRTNPQMIIQCEEFVHIIRLCTAGRFIDRSGGLLGAMLATGGEWDLLEWRNAPQNVRDLMEAA